MRREAGFSLAELLVAMAITLAIVATVVALLEPAGATFGVQAETADMQQRLRVAADTLSAELTMAGGGPSRGTRAGPLVQFFAPVLPYRIGLGGDAPGTFRTDVITMLYVPDTVAETATSVASAATSMSMRVEIGPGCPLADDSCGFLAASQAVLYDDSGGFDVFSVTSAASAVLGLRHEMPDSPHTYAEGSTIVEVVARTYQLRIDPATLVEQLVRVEGGREVPVVDHVVGLAFDYYGDPRPPLVIPSSRSVRRTTYGPPPQAVMDDEGVETVVENCVFAPGGPSGIVPRLAWLGSSTSTLVPLTAVELTDGPWCPDALNPNRFDADLLRVRAVHVTVRIQAAQAGMRGPAGVLFARGGTSRSSRTYAPDLIGEFRVLPRNLTQVGR